MSFDVTYDPPDKDKIFVDIRIRGDLEEGAQTQSLDWITMKEKVRKWSDEKYIVFDLSKVTFWDTGGMAEVLGTILLINNQHRKKKAGFVEPENPHLVVLARPIDFLKKKFNMHVSEAQIPHRSNLKELMDYLLR